ncbi:MAG: PTS sugar transporter subunit IIB [Erysipelotrichaceae bacterium]|nr:PTS sugar transporter subunit IIB [Erysipelotrichaceae bacterium]
MTVGKLYVRVDDRLVHGQTVMAWGPTLGIKEIVAVDDVSAANPMLKSIMTMGVPKNYKTSFVTTAEALDVLGTPSENTRLLIVKFPSVLAKLKDVIGDSEMIYLGNIAKRSDTNHQLTGATGIFFLSDEDIKVIDGLVESGLIVCFQQLPTTSMTTWADFRKSK